MSAAKEEVQNLLKNLPDDATLDDIHYHLYVLEKIKRGQKNIADGRVYTTEQAKARLNQWLKP
jgi:predicted transcriptional regulator